MTEPVAKPTGGTPFWVKLLLGVSLALNLLIVGAVGGTMYRVSKSVQGGMPGPGIAFLGALEKDDRRAVLRALRGENRDARRDGGQRAREVLATLRSDNFDSAAFGALLKAQSEQGFAVQGKIRDQLVMQVGAMDPAARAAYADRLEAILSKRGRRNGDKKKP
ncbi:MAG: periplasmic heavy metal sensor [Pseudomonadota bacterium]